MIIPVILAGGSGTRLWPLSRELNPKQLLNLVDDKTMLQNTVSRLSGFDDVVEPIIICNDSHRFMVADQMLNIKTKPSSIILEPMGRDTAPALTVAAVKALDVDKNAIILVLPADHNIENHEIFYRALEKAKKYAEKSFSVTFGIVPDSPKTGFGYIKKGEGVSFDNDSSGELNTGFLANRISRFVEKPDLDTAKEYLSSGDYLWNSGMFVFKASHILSELRKFVPEIVEACEKAIKNGNEDLDFFRLDEESFSNCPSDSIDYAVMEKTENGVVIPLDAGWSDVGSWSALWEIGDKDENENVTSGDVMLHDVKSSYLYSGSRLIAAVGIDNHVVVETPDAVLISPKDRVQEVKHLVNRLRAEKREEAVTNTKVYRPWGSYESINIDKNFQVKRITVNPGSILSLQKHFHRAEHWVVVFGTALVTKGDKEFILKEDQSTYIPLGVKHRLENPGKIPLELIEVQSGSYLGEDDIVRFEDVYGR